MGGKGENSSHFVGWTADGGLFQCSGKTSDRRISIEYQFDVDHWCAIGAVPEIIACHLHPALVRSDPEHRKFPETRTIATRNVVLGAERGPQPQVTIATGLHRLNMLRVHEN
jgi:hypothetical protein